MNPLTLSTRSLATGAFAGLATFPVVVVVLNIVQHGEYHPLRQAMSELALGRGGWLMNTAFCAMGIGTLLLALTIRRAVGGAIVAPVLLALAGLLDFVSAAFHADGSSATTTRHGQVHQFAGIATFILFIAAMFVCTRSFRRDPAWRPLARPTLLWSIAAVATFFLIPILGEPYFGLAQRIFASTWLSWSLAVAVYGRRLTSTGKREPVRTTIESHAVRAGE